jgi:hypothetical protein
MRHLSQDLTDRAAENLRALENCHAYAVLAQRQRAGGELTPAERWQFRRLEEFLLGDSLGQRKYRRVGVELPATLLAGVTTHPGRLLDVSGGGMFLATDVDLPVGTLVQVNVKQSGVGSREAAKGQGSRRFAFPCVVRRVNDQELGRGLALAMVARPPRMLPC